MNILLPFDLSICQIAIQALFRRARPNFLICHGRDHTTASLVLGPDHIWVWLREGFVPGASKLSGGTAGRQIDVIMLIVGLWGCGRYYHGA